MDIKCPTLTLSHKNCFGKRNVGRYEIMPVWGRGVKNLLFCVSFTLLCSFHSSQEHIQAATAPSPGPVNENQMWEKREQIRDPNPAKPSQARLMSGVSVFVVSSEIWRVFAKHCHHSVTNQYREQERIVPPNALMLHWKTLATEKGKNGAVGWMCPVNK